MILLFIRNHSLNIRHDIHLKLFIQNLCSITIIEVTFYICYLSTAKGSKVDASQEMIAIGTTNIIGSFVSAYPATGSFARTAINAASGVRTQMNGLFTGILSLNLCIRSRISIAKSHNSTCNNFLM